MKQRLYFAILFFALLGTLLALTYYPDLPDLKVRVRKEWIRLDYIGHLGFYAAIAVSFLLWRTGWRKLVPLKLLILTTAGGIALGILTEITQKSIHGRSFNPMDIMYNCIGILAGVAAVYTLSRKGDKGKRGRGDYIT